MKIKDGFLLRSLADEHVVVPLADRVVELNRMMTLNDVCAAIWNFLTVNREYDDVVDYVVSTYEVDKETAETDVKNLLSQMESYGLLAI